MVYKTRIAFSCPEELNQELFRLAKQQGIPKGTLISELLEYAISVKYDFEIEKSNLKRIKELETDIRELKKWKHETEKILKKLSE